jgi:hypothetical protein
LFFKRRATVTRLPARFHILVTPLCVRVISGGGEKILALTKTMFTTEESDGPFTLKRITKAEAERYRLPDQL